MRPVNLIPEEDRRGTERSGGRSGGLAYVLVGVMLAALGAVVLVVLTSNDVSDKKAEVTQLTATDNALKAQVADLAPYTEFHAAREARVATVTSLADSRFDWERVMRELSLILPEDVWLTNLTGTATPEAAPEGAATIALREQVPGPALVMIGCAPGQDAVASFLSSVKQIDGVTRVGLQSSELPDEQVQTSTESVSEDCRTRNFIAKFEIVVAFDAAPVPAIASTADPTAAPPVTTPEGTADAAAAAPASTTTEAPVPAAGG